MQKVQHRRVQAFRIARRSLDHERGPRQES